MFLLLWTENITEELSIRFLYMCVCGIIGVVQPMGVAVTKKYK